MGDGLSSDGPKYSANRELIRPANYREWAYLTSGLGMTYGPAGGNGAPARFDNVFVNRESYRNFLATGRWPDKTMFVLEVRRSQANVSINNGGQTQGDIVAIESAVKDSERFPGTSWGYFSFDGDETQFFQLCSANNVTAINASRYFDTPILEKYADFHHETVERRPLDHLHRPRDEQGRLDRSPVGEQPEDRPLSRGFVKAGHLFRLYPRHIQQARLRLGADVFRHFPGARRQAVRADRKRPFGELAATTLAPYWPTHNARRGWPFS